MNKNKPRVTLKIEKAIVYIGPHLAYIKSKDYALIFKTHLMKRIAIKFHESQIERVNMGAVGVYFITFDYPVSRLPSQNDKSEEKWFNQLELLRIQLFGSQEVKCV